MKEVEQKTTADCGFIRWFLLTAGFLCIGLAILGIFLPLLPTIPLLLLAAACFARSSERFHRWLIDHPRLGPMIGDYLEGAGIPRRARIVALILIWVSILTSALFLVPILPLRVLLIAIGAGVSLYLLRLPTRD